MTDSTQYLVKNINKTFEVHNAIGKIEQEVLSKFDKAIREVLSEWDDGAWIALPFETLHKDYFINIVRKEWSYEGKDGDRVSHIWTSLGLTGDDPIWNFFGLPNSNGEHSVTVQLTLNSDLKQRNNYNHLISKLDELNEGVLTNGGFSKKGGNVHRGNVHRGNVNRSYEMNILFSNEDILKGLMNDDWDDAMRPLKDAWSVFEKVKWEFLKESMNNT